MHGGLYLTPSASADARQRSKQHLPGVRADRPFIRRTHCAPSRRVIIPNRYRPRACVGQKENMTVSPAGIGRFEFARLSSLRAAQLIRGCTPRVAVGLKPTTTAQREISARKVCPLARE